ncbi:MAG: TetR family transcriptional regulator [Flavobacteriales bacterium]|nr:TetR family transcriptional regulator [Flavobacteriales bacterium]
MSPTIEQLGLRERKAAQLKIQLVDLLTEELQHRGFHEIGVEELCEKAMISKVTFFKYFPTKDALLWYHSTVWIHCVKADCLLKGLEGVAALRFLFQDMALHFNEHVNLFGYYFSVNSMQVSGEERPALSDAEKLALHPDGSTLGLAINYSLGEFFRQHTQKARKAGDFRTDMTVEAQAILIGSVFQGSGLVGLRIDADRPGDTMTNAFNTLLKLLKP